MAIKYICGFGLGQPGTIGGAEGRDGEPYGETGLSVVSSPSRTGDTGYSGRVSGSTQYSGVYFARVVSGTGITRVASQFLSTTFYVRIDALPDSSGGYCMLYGTTSDPMPLVLFTIVLVINSDGTIKINSDGTPSSNAFTANDGVWHKVVFDCTGSQVDVYVDGSLWVSRGSLSPAAQSQAVYGFSTQVSPVRDFYFSAIRVYDGSTGGDVPDYNQKILLPTAGNSANSWTDGAGGTGDIHGSVDNVPPVGVAASTAAAKIKNGSTGGNLDYTATMQSYSVAGVPAGSNINAIASIVSDGEEASTGTKAGAIWCASNPTQSAPAATTEGSFDYGNDLSTVVGNYADGWGQHLGVVANAPSVTLSTAPTVTVRKITSTNRTVDVDFMGLYVDFTPPLQISVNDTSSTSEDKTITIPTTGAVTPSVNDTTGATTESVTIQIGAAPLSVNDTTGATTESVSFTGQSKVSVNDTTGATTENVTVSTQTAPSVFDATGVTTESVTVKIGAAPLSVNDTTAATTESVTFTGQSKVSVNDTTGATTESAAFTGQSIISVNDTTGATTESVAFTGQSNVSVNDTPSATTENVAFTGQSKLSVNDTTSPTTESVSFTGQSKIEVNNATNPTIENVTASVTTVRLVFDATGATTESITIAASAILLSVFDATAATTENVTSDVLTSIDVNNTSSTIEDVHMLHGGGEPPHTFSIDDTTGATTETISASIVTTSSVSDTTGVTTESVTLAVLTARLVNDTPNPTTENVAFTGQSNVSVNDATNPTTETASASIATAWLVFDTETTTESDTLATSAIQIDVNDTSNTTEDVLFSSGLDVNDTSSTTENVTLAIAALAIAVNDTTGSATESVTFTGQSKVDVNDATAVTTENVAAIVLTQNSVNDTAGIIESVTVQIGAAPLSVNDTPSTSEDFVSDVIVQVSIFETNDASEFVLVETGQAVPATLTLEWHLLEIS